MNTPLLTLWSFLAEPNQRTWQPFLPLIQIRFITGVMLLLAALAYARSKRLGNRTRLMLFATRCCTILALAVILRGPSQLRPTGQRHARSELAIVIDTSESMDTKDVGGSRTRLELVQQRWLSPKFLAELNRHCDLKFFGFADDLLPLDFDDLPSLQTLPIERNSTQLDRAVSNVITNYLDRPNGSIALLSDGHDTENTVAAAICQVAQSRGTAIHTVALGSNRTTKDLAVLAVPLQDYLLPNEPGGILVRLHQFGAPQARTVLRLRQGAKLRQQIPIAFEGRSVLEFQLDVQQPKQGQYEYQVTLEPVEGEREERNNRQIVFCDVQQRRLKVLVLEGQPFWDTKFLAQSLRKDERVELTQMTKIGTNNLETLTSRTSGQSIQLPASPEHWAEYDIVIVGRNLQDLLGEEGPVQLRDFVVEQGGHVVFARGRCYDPNKQMGRNWRTPMAAIEPVVWDDAASVHQSGPLNVLAGALQGTWLAPTKTGTDTSFAFEALPGLQAQYRTLRTKPASRVLVSMQAHARNERQPVVVTMPAGRGQVVALAGGGSWRWSLRPPDSDTPIGFYDTFWSNLVRWLVMGGDFQPGQRVSLQISRQSLRRTDPLVVEVNFRDAVTALQRWRVLWTDPAGKQTEVEMSQSIGRAPRFRAELHPEDTGVHQLVLQTPEQIPARQTKKFNVYDMNLERLDPSARPEFLQQLSTETDGRFLAADQPNQLLNAVRRQNLAQQIPSEPEYVWDEGWFLFLLLSCFGLEWLARRLVGLI